MAKLQSEGEYKSLNEDPDKKTFPVTINYLT